jgi:hypothetical protein
LPWQHSPSAQITPVPAEPALLQTSWYQGTDEETTALINKKQWDSPDAMAKSYLNLEQMNGDQSKIVKLPDFNNPEYSAEIH